MKEFLHRDRRLVYRNDRHRKMRETFMVIVFDMDNTLVDEFGSSVRPGIVDLLTKLRRGGITLIIWTNSRRDRAKEILRIHNLRKG